MKKYVCIVFVVAIFLCNACGFANDARGELMIPKPLPIEESVVEVEVELKMPEYNIPLEKQIREYIWDLCMKKELSYEMVLSLIYVESKFKYDAVSHTSDVGLFQLNPINYEWLPELAGIENFSPYDVYDNILCGVTLLEYLRNDLKSKGYCEEDMYPYLLLSFHMGQTGANNYIKKYGLQSEYISKITEYKIFLEQQNI